MKILKIGILGGGNVASHLISGTIEHADKMIVEQVLVRDLSKRRSYDRYGIKKTTRVEDIVNNPDIDVIVDCLPGVDLPSTAMIQSLNNNKIVLSCGKEVWDSPLRTEIIQAAENNKQIVWLNSLVANIYYDFNILPEDLTHKNITRYPSGMLFANRYAGALETSFFLVQDLLKILSK